MALSHQICEESLRSADEARRIVTIASSAFLQISERVIFLIFLSKVVSDNCHAFFCWVAPVESFLLGRQQVHGTASKLDFLCSFQCLPHGLQHVVWSLGSLPSIACYDCGPAPGLTAKRFEPHAPSDGAQSNSLCALILFCLEFGFIATQLNTVRTTPCCLELGFTAG